MNGCSSQQFLKTFPETSSLSVSDVLITFRRNSYGFIQIITTVKKTLLNDTVLSLIVNLPDERKKISKKTFCMTLYSHTFVLITFKIVKDRD